MLAELQVVFKSILKWIGILLGLAMGFFIFGIKIIRIKTVPLAVPWFTGRSLSVQVFDLMRQNLVPKDVSLIVTSPFTAFILEMKISFFLAGIISLPFILRGILNYLTPALHEREHRAINKVVIPSSVLFIIGSVFAYYLIIPTTIRILYSYTFHLGATALFDIDDFITLAVMFMCITGLMFLMPVFMVLSSYLGLIPPSFWKKYWRHAILIITVFTAVITPDGTGITMLFLALPLLFLYFSGMWLAAKYATST